MDDQVKTKWLAALRSGEYKQAKEKLADVDPRTGEIRGYCCLGVLCDLAVKEGVIPNPTVVDQYEAPNPGGDRMLYGMTANDFPGYQSAAELPDAVVDWAGLDYYNPVIVDVSLPVEGGDDSMVSRSVALSELNDEYDYDFNALADLIEDEL